MCFPTEAEYTALIIAATNNNQNITSLLIAKGANVNLQDDVRRETYAHACACTKRVITIDISSYIITKGEGVI